ncbi:delta-lactam-biosynthetic de-N-acetylase [Ectobacillus ponti]|uniref:Delta-lactam-biosynthetic de-N-acetylase n=1 Tax=Ectobacillus ponti TaxID=2961894 RepID=A0AA41XBH8_9BACI|nr:delta-lactam-biosynthetic de-N-acetylase [Ectobacillus ponti]MCP8969915.1 delta-lactam-biosynthetic de-N-acetylase [Ectobacillus ponti]
MGRSRVIVLLAMLLVLICPLDAFSYANVANHWGITRSKNEQQPDAGKEFTDLVTKYDGFFMGNPDKKYLYLTFDNGYENGYTPKILDVLKQKNVPATFFLTGQFLKEQPELVKRMVREGHIIGNHSWHHPDLTTVSDIRFKKELQLVEEEVKQLTGQRDLKYLRPPRGIFSERTLAISREMGYYNVFWSLAFVDWKVDQQRGWQYAYDNMMKLAHPGAVMLLHSISSDNAGALSQAIDDLRKRGYEFKSLDDLVAEKFGPEVNY